MLLRARINVRMDHNEQALDELNSLTKNPELYDKFSEQMRARIPELKANGDSCTAKQFSTQNRRYIFLFPDSLQLEIDVQRDTRNWEGALSSVDELIAYRRQRHMPWTERGEILEQFGRQDEALMSYKEAIRLAMPENYDAGHGTAPPLIQALFRLAYIYETQDRSADALTVWDEALSVADDSVIWDVQELMEIAGHYNGDRTDIYDPRTKIAVRACLSDAECKWKKIYPKMR
ncbi:tetratricopeptide repeat protein [Ruegeria lacuscaerulensis]|uniref:tetratricopeptide repeat protein n=1 Tax=Ruegeria lacuscaerulensis TaxID=55218 RepID=UPI0014803483|nr:tetratricopeptide repeat protein [Ruegeria lacuscaerulensis]